MTLRERWHGRRWRFRWCPFTWRYSWGWPGQRSGICTFDYDSDSPYGGGGGASVYVCVFGFLWVNRVLFSTRTRNIFS